jgi:hypothetical protein
MTSLLVVMQCHHDYDDAWASPILVTSSQARADAKVKEMTDRQVVRNSAMASIRAHMDAWRAANPRPRTPAFKEKPLPNYGPKRSKWSPEQLAEYKAIKEANQAGHCTAIQPLQEWAQRNLAEDRRFTATFPKEVQDDIHNIDEKSYWEIEEVPYED